MSVYFPLNPSELNTFNIKRYNGIPPSWTLIEKVIKKSGLKRQSRFELIWNIHKRGLTKYKNGHEILPARYWHIFYDFDLLCQMYGISQKKNKFTQINVRKNVRRDHNNTGDITS